MAERELSFSQSPSSLIFSFDFPRQARENDVKKPERTRGRKRDPSFVEKTIRSSLSSFRLPSSNLFRLGKKQDPTVVSSRLVPLGTSRRGTDDRDSKLRETILLPPPFLPLDPSESFGRPANSSVFPSNDAITRRQCGRARAAPEERHTLAIERARARLARIDAILLLSPPSPSRLFPIFFVLLFFLLVYFSSISSLSLSLLSPS